MEIQKPFGCNKCPAAFTNEDHLQVHKKRHEMSLNLVPPGSSRTFADCLEDQTPTPTRFIKNCEEVGLFQDLQNVNPFDEQFSQATSPTKTPTSTTTGSLLFPSEGDLNTPQIKLPGYTPAPIEIKNNSNTPPIHTKLRHKSANLKLDIQKPIPEQEASSPSEKKKELLERNREAAYRARVRRKQWIAELEVKCKMLEASLAHSQSDLIKQRAENQLLREELRKHYETCKLAPTINSPRILRTPAPIRPEMEIIPSSSGANSKSISATIVKRKRGRPKKGEERRPRLDNKVIAVSSQSSSQIQLIPVTILPAQNLTTLATTAVSSNDTAVGSLTATQVLPASSKV